ncbi:MAG: HAD-IA family hydrolase [Pseudomonadota bacterium]
MFKNAAVVSLDLDDTLWDVGNVIRRAETEVGRWLAGNAPAMAEYLRDAGVTALRADIVAQHPDKAHDFGFVRRAIYLQAAAATGQSSATANAAFAEFHRWRNTVDLFGDVAAALAALAASYDLIAVTNGTADLALVGIDEHFVDSVTAARAGAAKPHPQIFELAAELTGQPPERFVHVGDDPHLDVDGARQVGMQTVWVNRPGVEWPADLAPPDVAVADLAELAEVMGAG